MLQPKSREWQCSGFNASSTLPMSKSTLLTIRCSALKSLPPRLKALQRLAIGRLGEQQRDVQSDTPGMASPRATLEVYAVDERGIGTVAPTSAPPAAG